MANSAFAKMHEFETTHLKSRAGSGVAGIFMEEAAFLNPASLSFFNGNSIYFQRDMLDLKDKDGKVLQEPKNTAFVLSEGNQNLSGSLSYVDQEEGDLKRKRYGLSLSAPLNAKSAMGVSVRKSEDKNTVSGTQKKYYQTVLGVTHALSPQTTMGVVVYDAFKSQGQATRAILGFQHIFAEYVTLSFDLGANWHNEEIGDTLVYKGAAQIKVWNDFFLRFGVFEDKDLEEKGNGFGVSWIQPRLALEFAIKNTKELESVRYARTEESKIKETSFAVSLRF